MANIERVGADLIATGNIGCLTQISGATKVPMVHGVELLDWATGGPLPKALEGLDLDAARAAAQAARAAE